MSEYIRPDKTVTPQRSPRPSQVSRAEWAKSTHPHLEFHFAPAINKSKAFPWFNKPWVC